MAKNVKEKKKRIAHNKNDPLDSLLDSHQAALGSDLVAEIMSNMNSSLISHNLFALADSSFNQKSITQKPHVAVTSQNQTQSTLFNNAKRKLGLDKKFPLMEKSQKFLKHLKHNRKMPKPRAHLASLGQAPVCDNTKSETRKKVGNNTRKTASSPRKSAATNKISVKQNYVKPSDTIKVGNTSRKTDTIKVGNTSRKTDTIKVGNTSRKTDTIKVGNTSRKISPSLSVASNKTPNARGSSKKSEIGKKVGNISRKVSPYESVTTYQISPWLNNSEESTHEESKVKNKKSETVVPKKYSKKDDSSSVSDVNEEIRNVFGESETSDDEFEKFVQSQTKEKKMKRCKKQLTTGSKKVQKKSSTQKQKSAKKNSEVRYSSDYESDCDAKSKSGKKINKCPKDKSRKKSSKKNNTLSADECESEFDYFNDKLRKKSGKNNTPLLEDESESESELNYKLRKKSSKNNTPLLVNKSESESELNYKLRKRSSKNNTPLLAGESESESELNYKLRKRSSKNNTPLLADESESESELNYKSRKKSSKVNTPLLEDEHVSDFELNDNSRMECSENNTLFPEDEHYSVFGDNDVYTRNSSSDDETVINIPIMPTVPKRINEHISMSDLNSFDVTDSLGSNVMSESNSNLNISSSEFTEIRSKNGQVLTSKINALDSKHNFVSNELSATSSNSVTDISHAVHSAQESSESPMVIDLSSSDTECESAKSTNQFISTDKPVVRETMPNASKSQSDEESDLEIVDVVVPDEILKNVDSNQGANISTNVLNIKIEKQPDKVIEKHEAVFSTDICSKPFEADSESASLDHRVNDVTISKVIKQEKCDNEIFVLCDEKVSAEFSNSSQTSTDGRVNIKTTVIGEISTCKKEHPLENDTSEAEGMTSREKRLYEIACSNLKDPISDDKPVKFSSLSPADMKSMDVKTILQMFKNEFQTYQEIIETQESIGYSFKLLENRQAEKLLSLKSALNTYIGSIDDSGINTAMVDLEKIQASASRLLESNPGTSSLNTNTASYAKDVKSLNLRGSRDSSQITLVPLSSIQQKDIKPDISKLQNIWDSNQKYKVPSNEMSFGQKCVVCSKDAIAACQQCCKVFFCSDNCGITYWGAGHASSCSK